MPTKKTSTQTKRPKKKNVSETSKGICFTIMPFGGWLDDYYENIYCLAIEAAGLTPHRADDLYRPSTIVHDIWEYTKKSEIILADLSGKNANVLYELGLAHAIAKPVILITESLDDIPFDLRALRVIEYDKNAPDWGNLLKENIESSIKEILKSPLKSVLPAFLEVQERVKSQPISPHDKELLEIRQELDLLRREMRSKSEHRQKPRIPAAKAEFIINDLICKGFSDENIFDDLSLQGVPSYWITRTIEKIRSYAKGTKE